MFGGSANAYFCFAHWWNRAFGVFSNLKLRLNMMFFFLRSLKSFCAVVGEGRAGRVGIFAQWLREAQGDFFKLSASLFFFSPFGCVEN